jgi:hypothetical protein
LHNDLIFDVMIVYLISKKQTEEHSYTVLSILMQAFKISLLNCSASGKKRGGDFHVVKAASLLGLKVLFRPLFFRISDLLSGNKFIEL